MAGSLQSPQKKRAGNNPSGILLITPELLESLLVRKGTCDQVELHALTF